MMGPSGYPEFLTKEQVDLLKSAGFPTFDQYAKNPDNYRETWEEVFASLDEGPQLLRNLTKGKHVLRVCGTKVDSVGQMIRVAKDMGFDLKRMTYTVNLESVGNGQYVHHVNLVPREDAPTTEKAVE